MLDKRNISANTYRADVGGIPCRWNIPEFPIICKLFLTMEQICETIDTYENRPDALELPNTTSLPKIC